MKALRYIVFIPCLLGWAWWGWYYGWPLAAYYFNLLEARQGYIGAQISFWLSAIVLLWVYFAAAMNFKRVIDADTAPLAMKVLGYALVLPPGLFLDWIVNIIPMTVLFLDKPKTIVELVTGRLDRLSKNGNAYQRALAKGFGVILHALDPRGYHF